MLSHAQVRWSRRQNLCYFYGELSLDMTFHVKPNMDFELFRLETPIAVTFVHGDDLCPLATLLWVGCSRLYHYFDKYLKKTRKTIYTTQLDIG